MSSLAPISAVSFPSPVRETSRFTPRPVTSGLNPGPGLSAAAEVRTSKSEGSLQLRTQDGDIVNISFAAAQRSEGAFATNGSSTYRQRSEQQSLSVDIDVEGNLSKKELRDIGKLLRQLASFVKGDKINSDSNKGVASPVAPKARNSSIAEFSFAYSSSQTVEQARLSVYA